MDIYRRRFTAVYRRLFAALYFSRSPNLQPDAFVQQKEIVKHGLEPQDKGPPHDRMQEKSLDAKTGLKSPLVSPKTSAKLLWLDEDCCDECSICCEELRPIYGNEDTPTISVVRMSVCGHGFHTSCIKAWMVAGGPNSPNCRSDQRKLMLRMGLATG
jgi:hypothetical protein